MGSDTTCNLCKEQMEDDIHHFFHCVYAKIVWGEITSWWKTRIINPTSHRPLDSLKQIKGERGRKNTIYAIVVATIYLHYKKKVILPHLFNHT